MPNEASQSPRTTNNTGSKTTLRKKGRVNKEHSTSTKTRPVKLSTANIATEPSTRTSNTTSLQASQSTNTSRVVGDAIVSVHRKSKKSSRAAVNADVSSKTSMSTERRSTSSRPSVETEAVNSPSGLPDATQDNTSLAHASDTPSDSVPSNVILPRQRPTASKTIKRPIVTTPAKSVKKAPKGARKRSIYKSIKEQQRETKLVINKTRFARHVRHITQALPGVSSLEIRFQRSAVHLMQESIEAYLLDVLSNAQDIATTNGKRKVIMQKDLRLALIVRTPWDVKGRANFIDTLKPICK